MRQILLAIIIIFGCSNQPASDGTRVFFMEEVSEHNSKKSCWTVIKGSVYDVTDYLDEHPGGEAMLEGCGRDSTKMFENKPSGKSHSNEARKLLETYKIGQLGK